MTPLILLAAAAGPLDHTVTDYSAAASGRFSSEWHSQADPRYDWVEARVFRIWHERTDGHWLYQEQAIINREGMTPDEARKQPYFQFVSRITQIAPGVLRRDNFRVLDGAKWVGLAPKDPRIVKLSPADLAPASCHNRIEKVGMGMYMGRTESCANTYKGAVSMQSLSVTGHNLYVNWDRGFDAAGNRVWGPEAGGYIFKKIGDWYGHEWSPNAPSAEASKAP